MSIALALGAALVGSSSAANVPDTAKVVAGERLSDWLLRQPIDFVSYPPGLSWRVPLQQIGQARLKHHLLAQLAVSAELTVAPASRERLASWIRSLPVSGRVPIDIVDAHWLQAHPDRDPVLESEHTVVLPVRPVHVLVLLDDGTRCQVRHRAGTQVRAYLRACQPARTESFDQAWLVQPDGKVSTPKIADWNAESQDEPAPGAIVWSPRVGSGWARAFSAQLAEFLSTQGPIAADPTAIAAPGEVAAEPRARGQMLTANDWGLIGLLQTPTARMAETGDMRFNFSRVFPYGRGNVIMQPLDWLEAGFRYTNISNRLYGPDIAGDQAYKDKSLDFKLRLSRESDILPELALGVTDIGGTGLFSSEYLVASKRTGDLDWSLGIAWGYLGGSNNLGNPLSFLGKGFDTRQGFVNTSGGTVNAGSFFHGNTALFGGVQYQTPWENLQVKLEYDGNNYRNEPQGNNRNQSSPINVGIVYRYHPSVDLTAGIERGNTLMLGFAFRGQLDRLFMPKLADPPKPYFTAARPTAEPDWKKTAADLAEQTKWDVVQISRNGGELRIVFEEPYGVFWKDRIERAAAVLHRDAPTDINRFVLVCAEHGITMTQRIVLRDAWVEEHRRYLAMADHFAAVAAAEPQPEFGGKALWNKDKSPFTVGLAPSFHQNLGGPDGFILYQVGIAAPMEWRISDTTWVSGKGNLKLADNYENFKYDAPSNLPRVRTFLREYLKTSAVTMPNLQLTHIGQLGANQYYSGYAGYLEQMFAGVGAEWLYRPWHSPVAFGIDINHVRQRDFHQDFSLRDYRVNTGHATLYWDTGWKSTHVNLSAGQYLAGDRGVTVDISRTFDNGITLGAWATKTNVSAQTFGEGSFDKGIYVSIPFDTMLPFSSPSLGTFVWNPLTRDGGARLGRSNGLYGLTTPRSSRLTRYAAADPTIPAKFDSNSPEWTGERSLFGDFGRSAGEFGKQVVNGPSGSALLTGGIIVAASSLLDRPAARWAKEHQGGRWDRLGKATNLMPFLLAGGTGILWWGAGGELAAETAWSSIKSAAIALGTEVLAKQAIGRARPESELGAFHFSPIGKGAANSSFPSIHMGVSFALVTPFAEQYGARWLYAVAGTTAFGRIQQRKHFVSDVVAGGLIGYATGSLLLDQQNNRKVTIGPQGIQASWNF